jgi:hypothetical protein
LVSIAAANKERWSLAVAIGASMIIISMQIMRHEMRYKSFVFQSDLSATWYISATQPRSLSSRSLASERINCRVGFAQNVIRLLFL